MKTKIEIMADNRLLRKRIEELAPEATAYLALLTRIEELQAQLTAANARADQNKLNEMIALEQADNTQQKLNDLIQWIRDMLNHWDEHESKPHE